MDTLCIYIGGPHSTPVLKGKANSGQAGEHLRSESTPGHISVHSPSVRDAHPSGLSQPPWGGPSLSTAAAAPGHTAPQQADSIPLIFPYLCMYTYVRARVHVCHRVCGKVRDNL